MIHKQRSQLQRWGIFNLVGVLGFLVQLAALFLLKRLAGLQYLVATAIAVELTLLHNFVWHEHVTWADVTSHFRQGVLGRLIRFHLANGLISIAGNVAFTWMFVESLHWPYLLANSTSVVICSLLNFVVGDRLVFRNAIERGLRAQ
jgi:putative flippase GtrA